MEKSNKIHSNPLVILPAAGFGTRMGSPLAKEMLVNPHTKEKFIQFSLEQAVMLSARILLITRSEKKELIDFVKEFCENRKLVLNILLIEPTKEWPETILKSKEYWGERNILFLPDTDWGAKECVQKAYSKWKDEDLVYGIFESNKTNWGFVKLTKDKLSLCEKPKYSLVDFSSWGIIFFKKDKGESIFSMHLESTFDNQIKELHLKSNYFIIDEFHDRTRGESK